MTTPANNPPPPPGGSDNADADDNTPVFTASELRAAREQAAAEARRHFEGKAARASAPAQGGNSGDISSALAQLVQLQVAQALGGMKPAAPPPASQPGGSAPARTVTADTPMWQLSHDDLRALEQKIGPFEFKKRLLTQLRTTGQRFKMRR